MIKFNLLKHHGLNKFKKIFSNNRHVILFLLEIFLFIIFKVNQLYWKNQRYRISTEWSNLIDSILSGFLVSSIFYYLIVYLPQKQKNKRIFENFKGNYRDVKLNIVTDLIEASQLNLNEYNVHDLIKPTNFKVFFDNRNLWYSCINGLQNNTDLCNSITNQLIFLKGQLFFVLNSADLTDELFEKFKNASDIIPNYEIIRPGTDDLKFFMRFLWQFFTGYNSFTGEYPEKDVFDI